MRRVASWLWEGRTTAARLAGAGLVPVSRGLDVAVAGRRAAYEAGWLRRRPLPVPAASVGNLSVGGTGKTPVASWIARYFVERDITPGILLRGYGGDEGAVHRRLAPSAIVVEDADRHRGARAATRAGATVLVLDDGFQRLDVKREIDLVLVAAESCDSNQRTFPAGPWRERWSALGRATTVIVTRKSASEREAQEAATLLGTCPGVTAPIALAHVGIAAFRGMRSGTRTAPGGLAGQSVLAVAGIGNPRSFQTQLTALGAKVRLMPFADHHRFDAAAMTTMLSAASRDIVVITEKDAVKLERLWPEDAAEPLVAELVVQWEQGRVHIESALDRLIQTIRGGESRQTT